MKEIYYGRIPLGVPIQKRPPSKYASHPYSLLIEDDGYTLKSEAVSIKSHTLLHKAFNEYLYDINSEAVSINTRTLLHKYYVDEVRGLEPDELGRIKRVSSYVISNKPIGIGVRNLKIIYKDDSSIYAIGSRSISVSNNKILISQREDKDGYEINAIAVSINTKT